MIATCPKNMNHKKFITSAHIVQDWVVDETGDFLEVASDCTEVASSPDPGNIWECKECGAEANVGDSNSYGDIIETIISECKGIWGHWVLDERDGSIDIMDLLKKGFNRELTKDETENIIIKALVKWVDEVSEIGSTLAYKKRSETSQEEIGKWEDKWRQAWDSDPEIDL